MVKTKKTATKEKPVEFKWTYQSKEIRCGKQACKSCPHGPYLYRHRTVDGKSVCEYVGKMPVKGDDKELTGDWRLSVWDQDSDQLANARLVLGITPSMAVPEWHECLRQKRANAKRKKKNRDLELAIVQKAWDLLCGWVTIKKQRGRKKPRKPSFVQEPLDKFLV